MRLIGIGDNVCDVYLHLAEMFPGGQALNVAVFAKMQGIDSAYLGVFGDDEVAEHIENTLSEFGVDKSHCRHVRGSSSVPTRAVSQENSPLYLMKMISSTSGSSLSYTPPTIPSLTASFPFCIRPASRFPMISPISGSSAESGQKIWLNTVHSVSCHSRTTHPKTRFFLTVRGCTRAAARIS